MPKYVDGVIIHNILQYWGKYLPNFLIREDSQLSFSWFFSKPGGVPGTPHLDLEYYDSISKCIPLPNSEVMEGLELSPGLSFLNIGSGTGYFSTLAGLILGTSGISHGVEVHPAVVEYAVMKIGQFKENSPILDDFDFCVPKFFLGKLLFCLIIVEETKKIRHKIQLL